MLELSYFALFLLGLSCLAAAITGAVVATWSLRATLYDVSSRLEVVEGNLLREVKARAGQERWKKPEREKAELEALIAAKPPTPQRRFNWWETDHPREFHGGR